MQITFPHLGPAYLPTALALKELGIPVVIPPLNTAETLEKGRTVSPEEMCLPFKYMAGNLIQAYEQGARRVIMPATMGPCRLGEYGELLREVLHGSGFPMEWILMDTPRAIGLGQWLSRLRYAGRESQASPIRVMAVIRKSMGLVCALDRMEAQVKLAAGFARQPGDCVNLLRNTRREIQSAQTLTQAKNIVRRQKKVLEELPVENKQPVKVLLVGEFYTSIEPSANQNLEEQLMLLGCCVKRPVTISWWMKHTALDCLPFAKRKKTKNLPYSIGGYAKETVEEISRSREDGIIQIMPAGCMPEIVAKAASNAVSEEKDVKILHLVFDEMQANAGYETRVEAFVDMLERRKRVFSGN